MLARTGPRPRRDPTATARDSRASPAVRPDEVAVSALRSGVDLRCVGRGIGPDRSGSSLAYASAGVLSARAAGGSFDGFAGVGWASNHPR
ncbi:hypothetical protein IWGMT90018_00090 [Mycobacterium kiyosense]|nr:hypothetical protein IWGMT90018_00090 [Mycobacterium kiyosense]